MKISKIMIAAALCAVAIPANAQFSSSSSSSSDAPDAYNRISVGYNANFFGGNGSRSFNEDDDKGATFNGLNVQYTHGWHVTNKPLYIEAGLKLNAGFHNISMEEYEDFEAKFTKMSLSVPVNIAYRIACGDNISIQPYTGLHFGLNVLGKAKLSYDEDEEDYNFFDKDEVGKDAQWKRFQMGWQIGCGLNINKFYVGLEYGIDFSSLAKKLNTSDFAISVGYTF